MSRPRISLIGQLRYSETEGLQFSIPCGGRSKSETAWLEALPNADEWPGIQKTKDRGAYARALHADPSYRLAAKRFLERQCRDPQFLLLLGGDRGSFLAYRDKVLRYQSDEPETVRDKERAALLVKHYVLRRERHYERVQREIDALENLEKLGPLSREPIPESVRLFVWQRDKGQCVKCGSRERIEYDHIIPIAAGGSSSERNIQLLCESCNRSKGSTI